MAEVSTSSVFCLPPRGVDAEVLTPPSQNGTRSRRERRRAGTTLFAKEGRQEWADADGRRLRTDGRTPCGAHLTREMGTSNVESLEPRSVGRALPYRWNMQACPSLSLPPLPRHDQAGDRDQERTTEIGGCEQISMRERGWPKKERIWWGAWEALE